VNDNRSCLVKAGRHGHGKLRWFMRRDRNDDGRTEVVSDAMDIRWRLRNRMSSGYYIIAMGSALNPVFDLPNHHQSAIFC